MRILVAAVVLSAVSTFASAQDKPQIQKEVIEVDRARESAFEKGDGQEWANYIADDCLWIELATGEVAQDKAERVPAITKRGQLDSEGERTEEKFHIEENRVVQTGLYTWPSGQTRFARIYVKQDGGWRMIALYGDKWPE